MHKRLSQEWLKAIACVSMLIDHIGYSLFPHIALRLIGRLAFPIYCFLLVEGCCMTRSPRRYGQRLVLGAALSEIPFDILFFGGLTLSHQSVMLTLLLGFLMIQYMQRAPHPLLQLPVIIPFFYAARLLHVDYSSRGILLIALFYLSRQLPGKLLIQTAGLAYLFLKPSTMTFTLGPLTLPWTACALLAMIPIGLYSGEKKSYSKPLQQAFYLFYPVHMVVLIAIKLLMYFA